MYTTKVQGGFIRPAAFQHFPAASFPSVNPVHWLHSHFAVGGWSPLSRLSGMLTAHMTSIAPRNGFTWHPHRGLEIYTWVLDGTLYHEDTTGGKGEIQAGELQRMFSGDWIEHQELNHTDEPVRVIQIWYAADPQFRGLQPHYQQLTAEELPATRVGDATVVQLIHDGSPMEQHVRGRLTNTRLDAGGSTDLEAPRPGEDLLVYVTDGRGGVEPGTEAPALDQYDVLLATPQISSTRIWASLEEDLHYMCYYLPSFIPALH